ncbi:MAG TPA: rhodanese-like domain-containing protein [Methanobacteriaceae archaeon]|nr:rhodanese-like domain-containing protein [Methanobacteriaceae archaeon]
MAIEDLEPQKCLELIKKNENNPNFIILDVRGPKEHAAGHVENSVLLEVRSPDFKEKLEELDKDKKYLVYCKSGMRSKKATKIMEEMGFLNLCTMKKGFKNWVDNGLPQE